MWPRTITIIDYDHRKDAASDAELIARQQAAEIEAPGEELAQLTHRRRRGYTRTGHSCIAAHMRHNPQYRSQSGPRARPWYAAVARV